MSKPRGPRAQRVVDEFLPELTPAERSFIEWRVEKTLRYQLATVSDALAELGRVFLDAFRWRRA